MPNPNNNRGAFHADMDEQRAQIGRAANALRVALDSERLPSMVRALAIAWVHKVECFALEHL